MPAANAADYERRNLANPDILTLVADDDGSIVGRLTGSFAAASAMWTAPNADLVSIHVSPSRRGNGVGAELVAQFRAWATGRSVRQLRVSAYSANQDAIRFYERHGFRPLEVTLNLDL